jgi:tetratricopeptide (TPR) repeat protein
VVFGIWKSEDISFEFLMSHKRPIDSCVFAVLAAAMLLTAGGCGDMPGDFQTADEEKFWERVYEARGKHEENYRRLDRALDRDADDLEARIERGYVYLQDEDTQSALFDFRQAIEQDERNPRAQCGLIEALIAVDSLASAIRAIRELKTWAPEYAPAFYWMGMTLIAQEDYDEAIKQFDEAIRLNPTYSQAYAGRATARLADDPDAQDEALTDYRRALYFNPQSRKANDDCGRLLLPTEQYDAADRTFVRLIDIAPGEPEGYSGLGISLSRQGLYDKALVQLDRAVDLDGYQADTFIERARVYLAKERPYMASSDLDDAISLDRNNAEAYYLRGESHRAMGQSYSAVDDYTEAIRLAPEHAKAYYGRAEANEEMSHYKQARRDRRKALRLDPSLEDEEDL